MYFEILFLNGGLKNKIPKSMYEYTFPNHINKEKTLISN